MRTRENSNGILRSNRQYHSVDRIRPGLQSNKLEVYEKPQNDSELPNIENATYKNDILNNAKT